MEKAEYDLEDLKEACKDLPFLSALLSEEPTSPHVPLSSEERARYANEIMPKDVGICGGCKEEVEYFPVVINGYKCPKCHGLEKQINWD